MRVRTFEHELEVSTETYKAALKAEGDAQLTRLNAELAVDAKHREIQFSKLREHQMAVFPVFYSKLVRTFRHAKLVAGTAPGTTESEAELHRFAEAFREFRQYYQENEIYFNTELCSEIDKLIGSIQGALTGHALSATIDVDSSKRSRARMIAMRELNAEGEHVKKRIAEVFRNLLGV